MADTESPATPKPQNVGTPFPPVKPPNLPPRQARMLLNVLLADEAALWDFVGARMGRPCAGGSDARAHGAATLPSEGGGAVETASEDADARASLTDKGEER